MKRKIAWKIPKGMIECGVSIGYDTSKKCMAYSWTIECKYLNKYGGEA